MHGDILASPVLYRQAGQQLLVPAWVEPDLGAANPNGRKEERVSWESPGRRSCAPWPAARASILPGWGAGGWGEAEARIGSRMLVPELYLLMPEDCRPSGIFAPD